MTTNTKTLADIIDQDLTTTEYEVLKLLSDGLMNKEIAHGLQMAEATVKTHMKGILKKMGLSNRTAAAVTFVRWRCDQKIKDFMNERRSAVKVQSHQEAASG